MSLLIMKMMVMHNDQVVWEELDDMEEAEDHPVGEPPEVRGGYHGKSSGGHLVGEPPENCPRSLSLRLSSTVLWVSLVFQWQGGAKKLNVLVEYMIANLAMQKSFHEVC